MHQILSVFNGKAVAARLAMATTAVALSLAFAGCKDAVDTPPESDVSYYPVAVGNFWVYAVADTTWSLASQFTPSVATGTAYQFREMITGQFTDAAGKVAYRMVRSRRENAAGAWRDDSVFVLSATPQFVALNRNNSRTVELVFPVRAGRSWNFNAFNNDLNDTITAETRQYSAVKAAFTTGGGTSGLPPMSYPETVTTTNTGEATENSLLKRTGYQQVFAKGVGPVLRRRFNFAFFNYTSSGGSQVYPANSYFSAFTRRETLIEYGPR
ncbi:MAG TPA: hypothetical protein VF629_23230 [Hymenobacter sp.]|uniref:hypothetical protein n=1 Tax=Hymenobacter sp. TaxID=1898978 RepID=UPI002ED94784